MLLGLLLRFPQLQTWFGWIGAFIGFMLADLFSEGNISRTVALTAANLTGVICAFHIIQQVKLDYNRFNHGLTFLYLFLIISVASFMSAVMAILTVPYTPNTFMKPEYNDFIMWWTSEIHNMILVLPIILTWPYLSDLKQSLSEQISKLKNSPRTLLPLIIIIFSVNLSFHFNGPGTLVLPIAGMIWAALTYSFFTIALLNLIVCSILYYQVNIFYIHTFPQLTNITLSYHDTFLVTLSSRLGTVMIALAVLTVALINQNRSALFKQLRHHVDYDTLTQAMSRRNFLESTLSKLRLINVKKTPFALLMIDLDYFKRINDNYGHHIGDLTLQHFVKVTQKTLRQNDLFGRLGGEEFAVFLADIQPEEAIKVAKRIQENLESMPLILSDQTVLTIRISIGLLHHNTSNDNLEELLSYADQALYKAKELGRNQVYVAHASTTD